MKTHSKYFLAGAVALLTFAVYLPALQNNFVEWDDGAYVFENPHIRSFDFEFLKWAFSSFYAANWHPLTWISHALDYAFWGLNPMGHHLTNNILHAVNTFLVVLLAVRLIEAASLHNSLKVRGDGEAGGVMQAAHYSLFTIHNPLFTFIAAVTTGLLFGLHPLHVESVAWVAERKDLLCALFYLLSIMSYAKYSQSAKGMEQRTNIYFAFTQGAMLLTLCFFILALLSKPMAVSLPLVLLILDWYPFQRIRSLKTFLFTSAEKVPFFALSLISSALTLVAQKSGESIASMEAMPFSSRVPVAFQSLASYMGKMVLPLHLLPFYPYPGSVSLLTPVYFLPIVLAAGITLAGVISSRKQRLWLSAWSYYVVILIPVIGIIQVGSQSMADRYTYLPSLGPFLVAGVITAWLYQRANKPGPRRLPLKVVFIAVSASWLILISHASLQQIGIWNDGLTLWNYVIGEEPLKVPQAYNNRGYILLQKGATDEAIADFRVAVSLDRAYADAYNNLCLAFKSKGLYDKAAEQCLIAVGLKPTYTVAHNNLGVAYRYKTMYREAIEQFNIALSQKPDYAEAYFNLGIVYLEIGDRDAARLEFEKGLKIKPDDQKALQVLNKINS